jgi:ABC-type nitrate/sulfonate/bicarbonate transport system substrate-binding protein
MYFAACKTYLAPDCGSFVTFIEENGLMSRFGRPVPGIFAVFACTVLLLAGCGGGGQDKKPEGSDLGTLRVVLSEGHSLPFIAADAGNTLGVWNGTGLKVETIAATSATVGATMAAEQADISVQAGNKAAADIIAGLKSKVAAGILQPWDQYIVASSGSGATTAADLKGKAIGTSGFGSAGHFATLKMAESLGWKTSDYKVVQMGGLKELLAALKQGTIGAFIWSLEPALRAEDEGYGKVLGSVRDMVGPNVSEAISVRDEVADERPKAVRAFFEGYFKAVKILQDDQKKAVDIMVNDWKTDRSVAERSAKQVVPLLSPDGRIPDENLKGLAAAIKVTVKGAGDVDTSSMYRYWQEIG